LAAGDVIDFFRKSRQRSPRRMASTLAELALDKCEETLMWGDWDRFRYWHAVYIRERNRLSSDRLS